LIYQKYPNHNNESAEINKNTTPEKTIKINNNKLKNKTIQINKASTKTQKTDFTQQEIELIQSIITEIGINKDAQSLKTLQKVEAKFHTCHMLKQYSSRFDKNPVSYSEKQKTYLKNATSNCTKLMSKYQMFSLVYNSRIYNELRSEILAGTEAQLLNRYSKPKSSEQEMYNQTQQITQEFLTEKNPFILESTLMMQRQSRFLIKNSSIYTTLGSHNIEYLNMINNQALTLISCQFDQSQTCSSNSNTMLTACFNDEQACGLNVQDWYQSFFTQAHLDDIDLLVNYYLNYSP